jgi:hypothetical protein
MPKLQRSGVPEMNLVSPYPFDLPEKEEPPKPTPFDYATRFIISLLSFAAVIASPLQQHPMAMGVYKWLKKT